MGYNLFLEFVIVEMLMFFVTKTRHVSSKLYKSKKHTCMKTKKTIQLLLFIACFSFGVNAGYSQGNTATTKKTKVEQKEIKVPLKILKSYVGTYGIRPGRDVVITLENNQLFGEPTGQTKVGFTPKTKTRFYLNEIDAELEFNLDKSGAVTGLTLFKGGREMSATRL